MSIELIVHPKAVGGMIELHKKGKKAYVCYFKGNAGQPYIRVNDANGVNTTYVFDRRNTKAYQEGRSEFFAVDSNHVRIPKYVYPLIEAAFNLINKEYDNNEV